MTVPSQNYRDKKVLYVDSKMDKAVRLDNRSRKRRKLSVHISFCGLRDVTRIDVAVVVHRKAEDGANFRY